MFKFCETVTIVLDRQRPIACQLPRPKGRGLEENNQA